MQRNWKRDFYRAVLYFIGARLLLIIIATAIIIIRQLPYMRFPPAPEYPYIILIISTFINIIYLILLYFIPCEEWFVWLQILVDIIIEAFLVYFTGGVESGFIYFFIFTILSTSILLGRKNSIIVASLITTIQATITILHYLGITFLPSQYTWGTYLQTRLSFVISQLIMQSVAYYLIAILSGYLSFHLEDIKVINDELINAIKDGLILINYKEKITFFNDKICKIVGLTEKEFPSFLNDLKNIHAFVFNVLSSPVELIIPSYFNKKDNRYYEIKTIFILDKRSRYRGKLGIFTDITELHQMAQTERRNKELELLRQISSGIAHELRNPLASIKGAIGEISKRTQDSIIKELVSITKEEISRIDNVLTEFLNFSKAQSLNITEFEIKPFIENIIKLFEYEEEIKNKNIKIMQKIPDKLKIKADRHKLKQVLINLLKNAIEASHKGGKVEVSVERKLDYTYINIVDYGKGIPEDKIKEIFKPFFSTKTQGTGLGLAISKMIIESHGGNIIAKTTPQNTVFSVILPDRDISNNSYIQ